MVNDAEQHAAEDKKRREVIELKNQGESLAYQTEKNIKEFGDKVPAEMRLEIERTLGELRDALKTGRRRRDQEEDGAADDGVAQAGRGDVQGPGRRCRAGAPGRRKARRVELPLAGRPPSRMTSSRPTTRS